MPAIYANLLGEQSPVQTFPLFVDLLAELRIHCEITISSPDVWKGPLCS